MDEIRGAQALRAEDVVEEAPAALRRPELSRDIQRIVGLCDAEALERPPYLGGRQVHVRYEDDLAPRRTSRLHRLPPGQHRPDLVLLHGELGAVQVRWIHAEGPQVVQLRVDLVQPHRIEPEPLPRLNIRAPSAPAELGHQLGPARLVS